MGKASRWFRGLLGLNAADQNRTHSHHKKLTWGFSKSRAEKRRHKSLQPVSHNPGSDGAAAAAEVQPTNGGRSISTAIPRGGGHTIREQWAAVTVQSHFRAYLSRRALRALKALVKLQALVRGHLVRKQTACALRRLQALIRAQIQIRANRILNVHPLQGPPTPEKFERITRARSMKHEQSTMLKRNSRMRERSSFDQGSFTFRSDDERSGMILELGRHFQSLSPLLFQHSPGFCTASSSRKSDDSRSCCFSNYTNHHPNYMSYTESSKAKARSHSAPRQRTLMERSSSARG